MQTFEAGYYQVYGNTYTYTDCIDECYMLETWIIYMLYSICNYVIRICVLI